MATSSTLTTLYGILVVLAVVFVFLFGTRGTRYLYTAALDDPSRLPPQTRPELWDVWLKGGGEVWEGMKPVSTMVMQNTSINQGPLVADDPTPSIGQQLWQRVGGLMHFHTDHHLAAHDQETPPLTKRTDSEPHPPSPAAPTTQTLQVSVFIQMPSLTAPTLGFPEGRTKTAQPPSDIPPLVLGVSTISTPFRESELEVPKLQDLDVVPQEAAGSSRRWDLSHL